MTFRRAILFPVLLALCTGLLIRAADSTVWPPHGAKFPPPESVARWGYSADGGDYVSYTYDGHRLLAPFHKTVTAKNATLCFHACVDYTPKKYVTKSDKCNSWTYNKKTKECSLSGGTGCTVYSPDPVECVKWYTNKDKNYVSGWDAFPLQ